MFTSKEGKNLPVESDIFLLEHRDKLGVRKTILFEVSREADIPESAEISLLISSVGEAV